MKKLMRVFEDYWVMIIFQMLLFGLCVVAIWNALYLYWHPGPYLMVERGDGSLAWLYMCYGASTAFCLALIQAFNGDGKYKLALMVFDSICLAYLFLFSDWFVNNMVYRVFQIASHN